MVTSVLSIEDNDSLVEMQIFKDSPQTICISMNDRIGKTDLCVALNKQQIKDLRRYLKSKLNEIK